ncbi:hypothetical protein [Streptomyces katrae]|uniref:hypothetical protein n=1 Tax=Streptomyces katrae TaxID=68223 RepID=UPI00131AE215|nr:hypothetical protein [Streptomyces katrae]
MLFIPIWIDLHSRTLDMEWLIPTLILFLCALMLVISAAVYGHLNFGWVALGTLLPLLGFSQWAYMTFYKPVNERPKVDVSATLEKINTSRRTTRIRGVVTLKNNGTAPAKTLGAVYVVTGHRVESAEGMSARNASATLDLGKPNRRHFGKYETLLSFDDLLATGESLAPGETRTHSFVFDANDGKQNIVRLTAYISMSTPNGDMKPGKCKHAPAASDVCTRTDFAPTSLAKKKLGDEPFADTVVHFSEMQATPPRPPYLSTAFGARDQSSDDENVQNIDPLVRDQFTQSITELRLDP